MRKVPVEQAVGLTLGYDITRIVPGRVKDRAFKKGHIIEEQDISDLKDLGKKHVYVWEPGDALVHENEAALRLAKKASGEGVSVAQPNQGRVNLIAEYDGLANIRVEQLTWLNNLEEIVFATIHNKRTVTKGQMVAGTRVVPIAVKTQLLAEAERVLSEQLPLVSVKPFKPLRVAVVITGTEVSTGRIEDGFYKVIEQKISPFGGRLMGHVIVSDDSELISQEIRTFLDKGAELVLVTGGMSVDPDDSTPGGIKKTGADIVFYGAPVLPGSQFMLAYYEEVPICGVPGGVLYSRKTTLDILLPRIFAQEKIDRASIVSLGHGGLCDDCKICHYPVCPFGKTTF